MGASLLKHPILSNFFQLCVKRFHLCLSSRRLNEIKIEEQVKDLEVPFSLAWLDVNNFTRRATLCRMGCEAPAWQPPRWGQVLGSSGYPLDVTRSEFASLTRFVLVELRGFEPLTS